MISGTSLGKTDNTSSITVCGGTDNSKGGSITIYGKDKTNNNGEFSLVANDGTSSSELWGKPNGTLTWGNKKVDTIEEQGDGYIRYSNGLQICWGTITWRSDCATKWGTLYETSPSSGSYAKSFVNTPSVSVLGSIVGHSGIVECTSVGTKTQLPTIYLCRAVANDVKTCVINYVAIGHWK